MAGITATYISANSFSVVGDLTADFDIGRRVKLIGTNDWFGTISASSYVDPDTIITLTAASDDIDSSLTEVYYGIVSGTEGSSATNIHTHDGDEGSGGQISHTNLSNIGTNTHAQIDTGLTNSTNHIANNSNPHSVTKTQIGLSNVPNTDFTNEVNLNTTHRTSDGKDHNDVVLNNSHRSLTTGNPHNVTLNDVGGTTDHTALSNIGTNTHAQIDTAITNSTNHIADTSNPHEVNASDVGLGSIQSEVDLNTTHRTSDGKDHSDVVLNNSHRIDTSNPHSVLATQITDFDNEVSNNTDVASNTAKRTYPTADETKVGYLNVTQTVDLDTMESDVSTNNAKNSYPTSDATKVGYLTVTQAVDLDTMESDVSTNNAKVTNATHTGEVTGSTTLTIANNVVDEANLKVSNSPTDDYVLTADSSETGGLKWAEASGGSSSDPISGATDNTIVRADGSSALQDSGITISDTDDVVLPATSSLTCPEKLVIPTNEPTTLVNGCIWIA